MKNYRHAGNAVLKYCTSSRHRLNASATPGVRLCQAPPLPCSRSTYSSDFLERPLEFWKRKLLELARAPWKRATTSNFGCPTSLCTDVMSCVVVFRLVVDCAIGHRASLTEVVSGITHTRNGPSMCKYVRVSISRRVGTPIISSSW